MDEGPGNAFTQFFRVIGSKINLGRSVNGGEIKLKFLRARLRESKSKTAAPAR
jgi:hypothetical protein